MTVITGIGVVSPLGPSLSQHAEALRSGRTGLRPRDAQDGFAPLWAPAYDERMAQTISNRMLRKLLQRTAVMSVIAAGEALRDAGLEGSDDILAGAGLYLASVSFDVPQSHFVPALEVSLDDRGAFDLARFAARGIPQIDPLLIVKSLPNAGICAIAIEHGVLGPNLNISNGSSGGLQALAAAARAIENGEAEAVVAGAYDSLLQPEHIVAETLGARTAAPGEGAVIFVLESEGHASARGARAYAAVAASHESFESLEAAAAGALRACGARPRRVFGDLFGGAELDRREAAIASAVGGEEATVEGAGKAIGFTGAASGLFSAAHAALKVRDGAGDALVWHSDCGVRNVALVLTAAA